MRKTPWLISIALLAVSAAAQNTAAIIARIEAPQAPNRQGLDGYTLTEVMHKFHVPGVSIAVVRDYKIDWAKGYGMADVETNQPVETSTLFQAASISKPITAMAALKLIEQGRFSLDDDINTILKSWHVPK